MTIVAPNQIQSLKDYIEWSESVMAVAKLTLFRGQSVKGGLLPGIARKTPNYDTTKVEKTLLEQFRLMGASWLSSNEKNQLELLVIAQHYGLKTRLLDWTANPLAALYFACSNKKVVDAFVYALRADDIIDPDAYGKDPFSATKTRVFQPPLNNPRISAQHGWFTLHKYSDENRSFVPLEENRDTQDAIVEVSIPAAVRSDLMESLIKHGVGTHTMYPGLEGLAQHLNDQHYV